MTDTMTTYPMRPLDDLLQNWKRDHDECLIPECAAVTSDHSYCPEHR